MEGRVFIGRPKKTCDEGLEGKGFSKQIAHNSTAYELPSFEKR